MLMEGVLSEGIIFLEYFLGWGIPLASNGMCTYMLYRGCGSLLFGLQRCVVVLFHTGHSDSESCSQFDLSFRRFGFQNGLR